MKTLDEIIERATPLLREHEGIAAAYVLGSAASGALRADSDIDIALLPVHGRRLSLQDRLDLSARLENELGRRVDLGEINAGNPIYASEAILKGRRFFARDSEETAATETRLLGNYLSLREDRKEVEEAYRVA